MSGKMHLTFHQKLVTTLYEQTEENMYIVYDLLCSHAL